MIGSRNESSVSVQGVKVRGQTFAQRLVQWQRVHGRHDLPWQNTRDAYRVWLSEIMLQQTQVATVRGYYSRFLERFPDVHALAAAPLDEVMGLWSGLGYYSRARNLHACAQHVVQQHAGQFPTSSTLLQTLPGIGRSTAAAIASLCFGERVAILDANARRVVARVLAFGHDLAQARHLHALWEGAQTLLPEAEDTQTPMAPYTQGMMDLGAQVCLPKKPLCGKCPVQALCAAHAQGKPQDYPQRSAARGRTSLSLWLLWATPARGGWVYLAQRPTPGVWAGLHCLPWFESEDDLLAAVPAALRAALQPLPVFTHVLTHRELHLHVWTLRTPRTAWHQPTGQWLELPHALRLGLPAPIRKLLVSGGEGG